MIQLIVNQVKNHYYISNVINKLYVLICTIFKEIINEWYWNEKAQETETKSLQISEKSSPEKKESWLDLLNLCLSPCGNLAIISSPRSIVICQGKWSIKNEVNFTISSRIDLKENDMLAFNI